MKKKHVAVMGFCCVAVCSPVAGQMGGMGGGGAPQGMSGQLVLRVPDGETMVVPVPNNWTPYSRQAEEKDESYVFPRGQDLNDWQQALRQESYHTTAGVAAAERVYELRTQGDERSCASFDSRVLSDEPENGYSSVLWRQVCELESGQTVSSLNKTVLGNERLHIVTMIWKENPSNRAWNQWTNYMNRVYVCDPEREEHPCRGAGPPAGAGGMRR